MKEIKVTVDNGQDVANWCRLHGATGASLRGGRTNRQGRRRGAAVVVSQSLGEAFTAGPGDRVLWTSTLGLCVERG